MITYTELDPDQYGHYRIQGSASLNAGTQRVFGIHEDRDQAYEIARLKAERAERALAALEVHEPDDLEHFRQAAELDLRILEAPDGKLVEATGATVGALLAAGYTESGDQSVNPTRMREVPTEVGVKGKVRTRKEPVPKKPIDEL